MLGINVASPHHINEATMLALQIAIGVVGGLGGFVALMWLVQEITFRAAIRRSEKQSELLRRWADR